MLKPTRFHKFKKVATAAATRLSTPTAPTRRNLNLVLPRGWPDINEPLPWYVRGSGGAVRTGRVTLADLSRRANGMRVTVWTPASETVLTRTVLPTRSRAKIAQALPYALEDQLLEDPDKLHFAYVHEPDGALAVAITARARLNAWTSALHDAGVHPVALAPALLALPVLPNSWSVTFSDDEMWLRSGTLAGFACRASLDAPPAMLVSALKETSGTAAAPESLIVFRPPPAFNLHAWRTALGLPINIHTGDFWAEKSITPPLNLLQGDLAPTGHLRQLFRPLQPAAIMLAIWLVGGLLFDVSAWWRLRSQHQSHVAEMGTIFRTSFPETKTVLDPAAQMRRNIEALQTRGGGPGDLLPLLTRIAPALQSQKQLRLNGLKYADRSLTLDMALPDYQALDAVKNSFKTTNLDVEVLAANSRAGEIEGRIRIQPHAAAKPKAKQRS